MSPGGKIKSAAKVQKSFHIRKHFGEKNVFFFFLSKIIKNYPKIKNESPVVRVPSFPPYKGCITFSKVLLCQ